MKRIALLLFVAIVLLAACRPVQAPQAAASVGDEPAPAAADLPLTAPLPADPAVRTGQLANGLTYYIRQNAEPEQRADIWLAIDAGSVLEDDDQKGLAHFLEHMLFNGTEDFPKQELINYLERIGMEFGPDVNAYTSWDETVYQLRVPTDDPKLIEEGFHVLQEWAANATIDPAEVDAERGVIVEEWRLRDLNAEGRVSEEFVKTLLANSRYAERLPIGDMEIIRNAPAETLRRFYTTWYRPDLMSVIAVGDFQDLDRVEELIRERFGELPNPEQSAGKPERTVPDSPGTSYRVVADPEYPSTVVYVIHKQDPEPAQVVGDFRKAVVSGLVSQMINNRLQEIALQADAPFLGAGVGEGNLVRPVDMVLAAAQTQEGKAGEGLRALLTELERVRRHGFTASELERARQELLRGYQQTYDERDNLDSRAWVQTYLDAFLTGATPTDAATDFALAQRFIPEISLEEVNDKALELLPDDNRAVILIAPEKEGVAVPDEPALAQIVDTVGAAQIDAYQDETVAAALLEQPPAPVAITGETTIPDVGVTAITLTNGVRVFLKPTDFLDDEVLLYGSSHGGSSLVSAEDYPEASLGAAIVGASGVGAFDSTALDKLLAGKAVNLSPFISDVGEGFDGQASPKDLETLFQLLYLHATQPRADEDIYAVFKRQIDDYLANRALQPESALEDAYTNIFCGADVRCDEVANLKSFDQLDLGRALDVYRERMADFDDAVFILVGSFDPQQAKQLAQTYLGNLPTSSAAETWRNLEPPLPQGVVTETVNKGIEERSTVRLIFSGPFTPTVESRVALQMVEGIADILVREELREKRGGIYGAGVRGQVASVPEGRYQFEINFTADPKRVDELVDAALAQLADLRDNGPSADNFAKVHEQLRRGNEERLKQNGAWLTWLTRYLTTPEGDLADIPAITQAIETVTPEQVQAAAAELLRPDRYVRLVLHPEGFQP